MTHEFNLQPGLCLSTANCPSASPQVCLIGILSIKFLNWTLKLILLPKLSTTVFISEKQLHFSSYSGQNPWRHSWLSCLAHIHPFTPSYPTTNPNNSNFKIYLDLNHFYHLYHYNSGPSHHYILPRLLQWPLRWSPCLFLWILNNCRHRNLRKT